eukprot:1558531-Pleurochrysis_carterae.AAC.1
MPGHRALPTVKLLIFQDAQQSNLQTQIGVTPGRSEASMLGHSADDDAEYVNRAAEIGAWLDAHPEVTRFVVLDDRPSASDARLAPNFVHTKSTVGLTDADVRQALKILQG